MVSELGLKGNALAVYAIIYGFSQDGDSVFSGSSSYLCEWLGCSKKTALTTLADLTERGLLKKTTTYKNGITFCDYMAVRTPQETAQDAEEEMTPLGKILHQGGVKITPGAGEILHQGGVEITPHNTSDNTMDNYRDIDRDNKGAQNAPEPPPSEPPKPKKPKKEKGVKHKYGEYQHVLLTDAEYKRLVNRYGQDMTEKAIKYLDEYIEEKHYKSDSHNLAIQRWVVDAVKEKEQRAARMAGRPAQAANIGPNGVPIDPTKTDLDGLFR